MDAFSSKFLAPQTAHSGEVIAYRPDANTFCKSKNGTDLLFILYHHAT